MAGLPTNVSESTRRRNPHLYEQPVDAWLKRKLESYGHSPDRLPSSPEPEQAVRNDALGPAPREEGHPGRCIVRITSFRCGTLLDPDNLAGGVKYFIDALRYAAVIPDDRPQDIELQTAQVKVSHRRDERTEIEVSTISLSDVVFQQVDGAAGVSPAASLVSPVAVSGGTGTGSGAAVGAAGPLSF